MIFLLLLLFDVTLGQSCGADMISYNGKCVNPDCKSNLANQTQSLYRGLNATFNIQQNIITGTINISNQTLFDDPKTCMGFNLFFADPQTYQRLGTIQVGSNGVDGVIPVSPQSSYVHIGNSAYISFTFNNSDVQKYCQWISNKDYLCVFKLSAVLAEITQQEILFQATLTLLGICDPSSTKILNNQCVPLQCFDKIKSVNSLKSSNQLSPSRSSLDNKTYQIQITYTDGQTGWIIDDSIQNCVQAQVVFMADSLFSKPLAVQYDVTNPDGYYPILPILSFQRQQLKQIIQFNLSTSTITKLCQNINSKYQCFFQLGFKLVNQTQTAFSFSMEFGISSITCESTQTFFYDVCVDQSCFTTLLTNLIDLIQQQINKITTTQNQTDKSYTTQLAFIDGLNILDKQFCLQVVIYSQNQNFNQRQAVIQTSDGLLPIWPKVILTKQENLQIIQFSSTPQNLMSFCFPQDSQGQSYKCYFEIAILIRGILQKSINFYQMISVNNQCPLNQIFYFKGCVIQSCTSRVYKIQNTSFQLNLNDKGGIDGTISIPTQQPFFNDPINCLNYSLYLTKDVTVSPPTIFQEMNVSYNFSNNVESLTSQFTIEDIIKSCQQLDQNQRICQLSFVPNIFGYFQDWFMIQPFIVYFDAQSAVISNVTISQGNKTVKQPPTINITINTSAQACSFNIWPCPNYGSIFVVGDYIYVKYFITDKDYISQYLNQIQVTAQSKQFEGKLPSQLISQIKGSSILQIRLVLTDQDVNLSIQGNIGSSPVGRLLQQTNSKKKSTKKAQVQIKIYKNLNTTFWLSTINSTKQVKLPNFLRKNNNLFLFWQLKDSKYKKMIIVNPILFDSKGKQKKIRCIPGINRTTFTGCIMTVSSDMSKKLFFIYGSIKNNRNLIVKQKFFFPLIK